MLKENKIRKTLIKNFFPEGSLSRKWAIKLMSECRHGKIGQFTHYILRGHIISKIKIRNYLKRPGPHLLQVGGGRHTIKKWLNLDIISGDAYANATKPLPLPDNSIDHIFAEQFIEHISLDCGKCFMSEAFRVLKPGGLIRLGTPDLDGIFAIYKGSNALVDASVAKDRHREIHNPNLTTTCHFVNDLFRYWGHRFIYDEETLGKCLADVGFISIGRMRFGQSRNPMLDNLERHADREWMKDAFNVFMEGEKPV